MARILTIYEQARRPFVPTDMSYIRWLRMSAALAELGHHVDIASREPGFLGLADRRRTMSMAPRLRRVPLNHVDCAAYDVVKTLFHNGFLALEQLGGTDHPFLIAKLGSVVDRHDCDAIYFRGERRRQLFEVQEKIAAHCHWVTMLTVPSRQRWINCFGGDRPAPLLVPGAVDAWIPRRGPDPYPSDHRPRCLFAGNIYDEQSQPEAHARLVAKLNDLGQHLDRRSIRLYHMGSGSQSSLDPTFVSCLGAIPYSRSWDLLHYADVGLVLALGNEPNENESTKIYHYLRVGLPTVCESGFPNEGLIAAARLGHVVPNGDVEAMVEAIELCLHTYWDRQTAIDFILAGHTWLHRARIYDSLIREAGL